MEPVAISTLHSQLLCYVSIFILTPDEPIVRDKQTSSSQYDEPSRLFMFLPYYHYGLESARSVHVQYFKVLDKCSQRSFVSLPGTTM